MAYTQAPGRMNMPKTGRGVDAATLMTGSPTKFTDPTEKKKSPKKNTSGIFGGDTIKGDENKDGTMLSRAINSFSEGSKRSNEQALRAKNYQQSIDNQFTADIKKKGLITAIKDNFRL